MSNHENKPLTVEWITPTWLLNAMEAEFGKFDLDPCACNDYQHNRFTQQFVLPHYDGLKRSWYGNVFMNPPYGPEIVKWVRHAWTQCSLGNASQVVCLLPARTDTQWFQKCWEAHEIMFLEGRVKFLRPDGTEAGTGAFPSVVVLFKRSQRNFHGPALSHASVKTWRQQYDIAA